MSISCQTKHSCQQPTHAFPRGRKGLRVQHKSILPSRWRKRLLQIQQTGWHSKTSNCASRNTSKLHQFLPRAGRFSSSVKGKGSVQVPLTGIIERGQALFYAGKPALAAPLQLLVLYVLQHGFQEQLRNLPREGSKADSPPLPGSSSHFKEKTSLTLSFLPPPGAALVSTSCHRWHSSTTTQAKSQHPQMHPVGPVAGMENLDRHNEVNLLPQINKLSWFWQQKFKDRNCSQTEYNYILGSLQN